MKELIKTVIIIILAVLGMLPILSYVVALGYAM